MTRFGSHIGPLCAMTLLVTCQAGAQTYPSKAVRIVTAPVGGGNDFASRVIAQHLTGLLGQPVIVDNRQSGLTAEITANSPPDGHTILLTANFMWIGPLMQKVTYDPVKSFAPITLVARSPHVLVAHPSLPVKTVKELIAMAKGRPGQLNYAAAEPGSANHLTGELLKSLGGVDIVGITYKGAGPAIIGLLGGQVHLMFSSPASVVTHIAAGRLKALGVSSPRPSPLLPDLQPIAATLPGFEFESTYAILAPAGTPGPIVSRLNSEIAKVMAIPEVREKFLSVRVEPTASAADELGAVMRNEMTRWAKVIRDAGLQQATN